MKASLAIIIFVLILFPLSDNSLDNQDFIDNLKLFESLNLKLYDIRFTMKYICEVPFIDNRNLYYNVPRILSRKK